MRHIANNKRIAIPVVLLVAVVLIFFFQLRGKDRYTGVVEATIHSHVVEVSGKLLELPVELGQHVSKGDVIAMIDSSVQQYQLEQLQFSLDNARINYSDLSVGNSGRTANSISIARYNYNSAVSANTKAVQDYQNAKELYAQGAITKDALNLAKVAADTAANAVESAKAQLDQAGNGTPAESAQLEIAKLESQEAEMKRILEKYTIKAMKDGIVMSKSYQEGDMVSPGYHLVDLAVDGENYLVFYLPIERLHSVEYDQTLQVINGAASYDATVKYIDVESEYTPKDMQTTANKNKTSVKVKLLLPSNCPLKPGQEAIVKI